MGNLDPWPQWAVQKALDERPEQDQQGDEPVDDWGARWRLEEPADLGHLLAQVLLPLALLLGLAVYALLAAH